MARSVRVAPLNVKKKKKLSKEAQMLFPLLAKRRKPGPLRFWQTLSNISGCRACGRSEGKGKFVIALVQWFFPQSSSTCLGCALCNQDTRALSSTEYKCVVSKIKPNSRKRPSHPQILGDGKSTQACQYSKVFHFIIIVFLFACAHVLLVLL